MALRQTANQDHTNALNMPHEQAQELLAAQIREGEELLAAGISTRDQLQQARSAHQGWHAYTTELLNQVFTTGKLARQFSQPGGGFVRWTPVSLDVRAHDLKVEIRRYLDSLKSIYRRIELFPIKTVSVPQPDVLEALERIAGRFHIIARQLRQRHDHRPTLDVSDEYDVQDLFHALSLLLFDDVRPEEWTPSYAGGASRMDFLLWNEETVVEIKKTRSGLKARDVGDQLLIDIRRYQKHPSCHTLLCFVYDPEGYIDNSKGLENDLGQTYEGLPVKCIVAP